MISDDDPAVGVGVGNPFPGLRPFEEGDNIVFFGRDTQIEALLERLGTWQFIAVVGESASGKSSLVRAGLLPALHGGFMAGAGARWRVAVLRPGSMPIANLAGALENAAVLGNEGTTALRVGLAQTVLEGGERGLIEVVSQSDLRDDENVLVIVDQFEELFRFEQDRDTAAAFVKLLLAAAFDPNVRVYVLLTMRSDFLGDCAQFRDLPEAINDGLFLVPRLTRDELREAITGPVGVAGGEISPLLVNRLLNEIGDSPDQLPVLQHALMRTWDLWVERGSAGEIGTDIFDETGGLAHALSRHADSLYLGLPERLQPVAERVFKALTDSGTDERGIRRATPFTVLPAIVGASPDEVRQVVDEFRGPGRSFLMPPSQALDETTTVDIAHESLMRVWERLQGWVRDEAESAVLYRRLSDTAQLHAKGEAALLVDPQLTIADDWRRRDHPNADWAERYAPGFETTIAFLDASVAERERRRLAEEARERREREEERRRIEAEEAAQRAVFQHQAELAQTRAEAATKLARFTRIGLYVVSLFALVAIALGVRFLQLSREARIAQSSFLARDAERLIAQGDAVSGMLLALTALPDRYYFGIPERPLVNAAEVALRDAYANQHELKDLRGHKDLVFSAAFSPDDQRIVSASQDRTIRIWDARTDGLQVPIRTLYGHSDLVHTAVFSPDGTRILSASEDGTARIWDAGTGQQIGTLREADKRAVNSAVYSPRGLLILTASSDGTMRIWDARTRRQVLALGQVRALNGHYVPIHAAAFSPDGRRIVSAFDDHTVRIWDARTGELRATLRGHEGVVLTAAYSPDGRLIASASLDGTARVWDAKSGKSLFILPHDLHLPVLSAQFSPDGQLIVTASSDATARIWSAGNGVSLDVLRGHETSVLSAAFSHDGERVATASSDKSVRLWDVRTRETPETVLRGGEGGSGQVVGAAYSPDGTRIVSGSLDGTVRLWDANAHQLLKVFRAASSVLSVAFAPDGRHVAATSIDHTVRIWDVVTGTQQQPMSGTGLMQSVAYSSDGAKLVTAAENGTICIWDAQTGEKLQELDGDGSGFWSAVFSPDGRTIAIGSADDLVRIWDPRTGKIKALSGHTGAVYSVAYSPDGKLLASASADGTARIWNAATGRTTAVMQGHEDIVHSVAFSPDGQHVVTASYDRTLRIWDTKTGAEVGIPYRGHTSRVTTAVYPPHGTLILSASYDHTVRIWAAEDPAVNDLSGTALVETAKKVLPRQLTPVQRVSEFLPS